MTGALYLTDGTTRINLLTGIDGFYLDEWNPALPGRKSVWRESPLTDGRKPALMRWSNATETMRFKVSRFTQDDVIHDTQDLRRLLLAAEEYFLGGSDVPVWLEARGNCETNTRYAVVVTWGTGSDTNPYNPPFDLAHPAMTPWTLTLERQHWRHMAPGTSECVELSATQDYYDAQEAAFVPTEQDDDCWVEHVGGTIDLNDVFLLIGDAAGQTFSSGVRVRNVTIPQGATILGAWMTVEAHAGGANDNVNVIISADDVDDAAIFSTYADYMGRARTTAHVHWDAIGHWVAGTYYNTPDITPVIQEIISRPAWASGNDLALLIENNASTANAVREAVSWDHPAVRFEPHLYVHWVDSAHTSTFGRTATCNNEVYIANKHNIAQLTHIYYDDGGVFSANLVGAALPFAFLPAAPAVNDAVYFGIASLAPDSGPFCSLVFDIGTAQVDLTTVTWQYYDSVAAGWHDLTVRDNTNADGYMTGDAFDTTGVNSVHWIQPAGAAHNWGTVAVNGILGYWVRALVAVIGAAPAAPTQQNRAIYTIVTPYVDTTAANVLGDIQALNRQYLEGQSGRSGLGLMTNHVVAGLRSYDKGADFSSYINLADEQNAFGINIQCNAIAGVAFAVDAASPTGEVAQWTTAGVAAQALLVSAYITSPLAEQYVGVFRCFLRLNATTDIDNLYWLVLSSYAPGPGGWPIYISEPKKVPSLLSYRYIDFGLVTLPPVVYDTGKVVFEFSLNIYGQAVGATAVNFSDLILIPADECFIDTGALPELITGTITNDGSLGIYSTYQTRLDMNSLVPRRMITSEQQRISLSAVMQPWDAKISGPLLWQPNERQRWWYFMEGKDTADLGPHHEQALSAQSWHVARYLSMRGAR